MVNSGYDNTDWWLTYPSEKYEFLNGKDDIPYMKWKNKIHVPNHQPAVDWHHFRYKKLPGWFPIYGKIKNVPNHQPGIMFATNIAISGSIFRQTSNPMRLLYIVRWRQNPTPFWGQQNQQNPWPKSKPSVMILLHQSDISISLFTHSMS